MGVWIDFNQDEYDNRLHIHDTMGKTDGCHSGDRDEDESMDGERSCTKGAAVRCGLLIVEMGNR